MDIINLILERTVTLNDFNRGMGGKIFADVRKNGPKVVMKNNKPECVLLSPEDYVALVKRGSEK